MVAAFWQTEEFLCLHCLFAQQFKQYSLVISLSGGGGVVVSRAKFFYEEQLKFKNKEGCNVDGKD
jgi:hypothetical protein